MSDKRPNTAAVLDGLKDFQRDTVEYVFRRLYTDEPPVTRFLVADEVGLGKTLVARGVIARALDHLWDHRPRIDILYVCSNSDIARQNIRRLNLTDDDDFAVSSRITLLPLEIHEMSQRKLNFVSFTPQTSLELVRNSGRSRERQLLFHLLEKPWKLPFKRATRVLAGSANTHTFRRQVEQFPRLYPTVHPGIRRAFLRDLSQRPELRRELRQLCRDFPRANAQVPHALHVRRNHLIGQLRKVLAQTCLHWLKPDLIILDEFQRFKHLLGDRQGEMDQAAELAHHLFNYQRSQDDPSTAARILLLSATPYKMYTLDREAQLENHHADLLHTLKFLMPAADDYQRLQDRLKRCREEIIRLDGAGVDGLAAACRDLEQSLKSVMARTERLAVSANRDGMLREVPSAVEPPSAADVEHYLTLRRIADALGESDVIEYWKSAPYLLNFMERYDLRRTFDQVTESQPHHPDLIDALQGCPGACLDPADLEHYRSLDPGNARIRRLKEDTLGQGAWRLLWIPPSLTYYRAAGPYADPALAGFTKRLVFSCWRVVPRVLAALLSYEAERLMVRSYRKSARNTPEARKKRQPLLRFKFRNRHPVGMPALALIYPCQTLATRIDPLPLEAQSPDRPLPTLETVLQQVEQQVAGLLAPMLQGHAPAGGTPDEAWYWAAPLLLDRQHDSEAARAWFSQPTLADLWSDKTTPADGSASGWARHVAQARQLVEAAEPLGVLGPPPPDLARVLALLAVAGPGVASLRALRRVFPEPGDCDLRTAAAPVAHSFLHLFNLPEATALLRDRQHQIPYWESVLRYCADGNLQAVLDEYAHVLLETLGLMDRPVPEAAAKMAEEMRRSLTLRAAAMRADEVIVRKKLVCLGDPLHFRTRFAMRFGDQEDAEDGAEPTRADQVRAAFNSPFWPFILATTSVGQEGLDFHPYCHAVVHWNLPSNPVDLEQREGRVHRYKNHAVRRNVAAAYGGHARALPDPWRAMFDAASRARQGDNDLEPFWVMPKGDCKIERHVLTFPHSREVPRHENLKRTLVLYRLVFGQNRQEDLVHYLDRRLSPQQLARFQSACRIDLSPPRRLP